MTINTADTATLAEIAAMSNRDAANRRLTEVFGPRGTEAVQEAADAVDQLQRGEAIELASGEWFGRVAE